MHHSGNLILASQVTPVMDYERNIEEVSERLLNERLARVSRKREIRFRIKLAGWKRVTPLYKNGRLIIEHPLYSAQYAKEGN